MHWESDLNGIWLHASSMRWRLPGPRFPQVHTGILMLRPVLLMPGCNWCHPRSKKNCRCPVLPPRCIVVWVQPGHWGFSKLPWRLWARWVLQVLGRSLSKLYNVQPLGYTPGRNITWYAKCNGKIKNYFYFLKKARLRAPGLSSTRSP